MSKIGDLVFHSEFGSGTVKEVKSDGKLVVNFPAPLAPHVAGDQLIKNTSVKPFEETDNDGYGQKLEEKDNV